MLLNEAFITDCEAWLYDRFDELTDELIILDPSEWAPEKRYLPPQVTPMPGYYSFDVAPYLREIIDCLSPHSPIREVDVMKGVQICFTVGVLENIIGYVIDHIKNAPVMFLTADAELAQLRMESYVTPMINYSGLDHLIKSADETNKRKTGKALEVNTLIPTPVGFRPIKDIKPGNEVYAPDGSTVTVDCESPIHERECFEITFANGETVIASDDHKWSVYVGDRTAPPRILKTNELAKRGVKYRGVGKDYKFRVAVSAAVPGIDQRLLIKPYTFGAWLGDGSAAGANIAVGEAGRAVLDRIKAEGYEVKKWTTKHCPVYGINVPGEYGKGKENFYSLLRRLKVLRNKHIPPEYLCAPTIERWKLLRGLMDTDGYASKRGACQITQKNGRLARDIWSLVNSLGMKATIRPKIARSQNGTEVPVHTVEFYATQSDAPFTFEYKLKRLKSSLAPRSFRNTIKSITPVGVRQVKCIGVAHKDHLFLCGRGYIPTHNTDKKIEWEGGGFLVPFGAQNATKLRSISIQYLLEDEIDGYPDKVGKDGDPCKLAEDRTAAYESSRKILRGSTPLISQTSKILPAYNKGDQRKFLVPCKHCHKKQELVFSKVNNDGTIYGIYFECDDDGMLIEESVVYICRYCQGEMVNDDKAYMLPRGEWQATKRSSNPERRSYHINALYSPVGMQTWSTQVRKWLDAWDVEADRVKDLELLQQFYNNVLGLPFEMRGEALKYERVVLHRRTVYYSGDVPNTIAVKETGSPILVLTCAVDVHKRHLDVQVIGWCKRGRFYSIEWLKLEGDCESLEAEPWNDLRDLIENKIYRADDGKLYRIQLTLIDAQYNTDIVHRFCGEYSGGVHPIRGTDLSTKGATVKEFSEFTSKVGTIGYNITTTIYKDRLAAALKRDWDGIGPQPDWHPNFPQDYPDQFFKELTVETKKEKINEKTKKREGFIWVGRDAHSWDLTVYCSAAHDMIALDICERELGLDCIDRPKFWALCEEAALFWE